MFGKILGLFHRAEIHAHKRHNHQKDYGQQRVKVKRNGLQKHGEGVVDAHRTGDRRAPAGNGGYNAHRRRRGVYYVREFRSRHLVLVGNRSHDRTHRQTGEIVVDEYNNAQRAGSQQRRSFALDFARSPFAVSARTARFCDESDQHAQKNQKQQNARVVRVCHTVDNLAERSFDHPHYVEIPLKRRVTSSRLEKALNYGGFPFADDR